MFYYVLCFCRVSLSLSLSLSLTSQVEKKNQSHPNVCHFKKTNRIHRRKDGGFHGETTTFALKTTTTRRDDARCFRARRADVARERSTGVSEMLLSAHFFFFGRFAMD